MVKTILTPDITYALEVGMRWPYDFLVHPIKNNYDIATWGTMSSFWKFFFAEELW